MVGVDTREGQLIEVRDARAGVDVPSIPRAFGLAHRLVSCEYPVDP